MKSFLGVLETGIVKINVWLGGVGPRALVRGEEREAAFVGELLPWLGRKSGILPLVFKEGTVTRPATSAVGVVGRRGRRRPRQTLRQHLSSATSHSQVRAPTPSTWSSLTDSTHTTLSGSMVNANHRETGTPVNRLFQRRPNHYLSHRAPHARASTWSPLHPSFSPGFTSR